MLLTSWEVMCKEVWSHNQRHLMINTCSNNGLPRGLYVDLGYKKGYSSHLINVFISTSIHFRIFYPRYSCQYPSASYKLYHHLASDRWWLTLWPLHSSALDIHPTTNLVWNLLTSIKGLLASKTPPERYEWADKPDSQVSKHQTRMKTSWISAALLVAGSTDATPSFPSFPLGDSKVSYTTSL